MGKIIPLSLRAKEGTLEPPMPLVVAGASSHPTPQPMSSLVFIKREIG
ncbi:MAG: hypothetical protein HUU21_19945 [Polyangiaceae bacterium]|nr:hypothetical protein [Polyangiaceae bacterium]